MSELENAIKTLIKTADNKELPYIIADIIKKNCDSSTINLLSQYLNETIKPSEEYQVKVNYLELLDYGEEKQVYHNYNFNSFEEAKDFSIKEKERLVNIPSSNHYKIVDIKVSDPIKQYNKTDNTNPSDVMECLEKILNKAFGYGVQATLDNLLLRGYNTKNMLEQEYFGNSLEKDLDEAKNWLIDLKNGAIKNYMLNAQDDKQFIDFILDNPRLLNVFAFDGTHTWEAFEDTFSDEDKEYINTSKEEFEYMRNQLIKRGRING